MSRTFRLRANRDRAPQATRPKTTHARSSNHVAKKRGGIVCSFCDRLAVDDKVLMPNGVIGALCGRRECRKKMEAL